MSLCKDLEGGGEGGLRAGLWRRGGAEQGGQVCPRSEQECKPDRQWITQGRLDSLLPAPREVTRGLML